MGKLKYYGLLYRYIKLLLLKKETLGRTTEMMAARRGDATFLLFEDERFTFTEFNARANRRANVFQSVGVKKGDVVCLLMENRPEYLESLAGLSKLGAIAAGINYNLKGQTLIHSLKISGGSKAIVGAECPPPFMEAMAEETCIAPEDTFVDTRWKAEVSEPKGSRNLNDLLERASPENPPAVPMNSEDLFMLIYTSGTTGMPKAARVNHLRWYSAGIAMGWYGMEVGPSDTVFAPFRSITAMAP